ncbi:MAG: hypothetical protein MUE60_03730 [Candidatus Eisenbacteria bacterium]|jgi:hypothetical protein|nr:hypothetical protein [Candidatus Eisenbacteria bacterium]
MQKSTVQLDIFETPMGPVATAVFPEAPLAVQVMELPEPAADEGVDMHQSLCLAPSAGIGECRECWERHPDLWPRYITRANCVKHTR